MTAEWMWARADLRARWKSWLLLGLLAGVTFGVVAAAVAGARRTADAVDNYAIAARAPTAAILANNPSFDANQRRAVAVLPEVTKTYPFLVPFGATVFQPRGLDATLVPTTARSLRTFVGSTFVEGRAPDPRRANEAAVDENTRDRFGLDIGSNIVVGQSGKSLAVVPPGFDPPGRSRPFRQRMRVVGIVKSVSSSADWVPSSGLYARFGDRMPGVVNVFVDLRRGARDLARLRSDVEQIAGHPVNVESFDDLVGIRKAKNVTGIERDGLLLFALAALLGGGVLVGQALVRAVGAGAADLPTWRAMGADTGMAVRALAVPPLVTAIVGAVTTVVVAVAVSSQFPIGVARRYDLDVGIHADWRVLGAGVLALVAAVVAGAALTAWWRVRRGESESARLPTAGRWTSRIGWSPALMLGSRLAVEPGRGRRAVPVRSALVGAIVGVLGVVACFTFRAGIDDALRQPERAGVVWDFGLAAGGTPIPDEVLTGVASDHDVAGALRATWHRAVSINGTSVPVFGTTALKGTMPLVVLEGRRPRNASEIAFAPTTMRELRVSVGDRVRLGRVSGESARVVGEALLPASSHTDYDQSGWMTRAGVARALGAVESDNDEDYVLMRWKPGTDVASARRRVTKLGGPDLFTGFAEVPSAIVSLGPLDDLPLVLGVFFGLLACATVAHALVTTVRRRRHDFAVLRSIGFTRRQSRYAVAWQSTIIGAIGVIIGVPLGIAAGRAVWRWLAQDFPIAYVPPLALAAVLLVVPIALVVANALAAGPARSAARIRPAETLRTE